MAMDSCLQNSSDQFGKDCTIDWDIDAICNHIICGNIVYDKKRLSWWNDYDLLKKFVESALVQRGKWRSPGGSARRFDSSVSEFIVTWYPGKLNSLSFNGKTGERARDFLINLCTATSVESRGNIQGQAEPCQCIEDINFDIEVLQSRVESMQTLINTHDDLIFGAHDLINEVTRLRFELEEEKLKNRKFEQQTKFLSDEVMKIKIGPGQASLNINTCLPLMTDKGVQTQPISQNNDLQTKDTIRFVPTVHSSKQVKNISTQSPSNYDKYTPLSDNQQLKQQCSLVTPKEQCSLVTPTSNTKKQTASEPPDNGYKRLHVGKIPSFDQQLKDYKMKHNYNPNDENKRRDVRKIPSLDQQLNDYRAKHNHNNGHKRPDVEAIFSLDQQLKDQPTKNPSHKQPKNHKRANKPKPPPKNYYPYRSEKIVRPLKSLHRKPPAAENATSTDLPSALYPFRLGPYPPTYHRSQEWLQYLSYVNRVTKTGNVHMTPYIR